MLIFKPAVTVGQAAGLGALPPVAGPAANDAGHVALAGIAHAQGAMDKHLNFHRAVPADSGDFFLGQLRDSTTRETPRAAAWCTPSRL